MRVPGPQRRPRACPVDRRASGARRGATGEITSLCVWQPSDPAASRSPGSAWAPTSSAGRPTATPRSPCSTPSRQSGGNFVDTSDSYMWRVPGNSGGESETIIGEWFATSGRRDDVVLATKVSSLPSRKGLAAANIAAACDDSLRRLRTDRIDLYYAHYDDQRRGAGGVPRRLRRARPRGQGARRRGVELHRRAAAQRAGDLPARRAGRVRRAAAALQPGRAHGVRDVAAAAAGVRGPVVRALLRAREGLPDRQVPRRRGGRRQPAVRGRPRVPRRPRARGARGARRDRRGARGAGGGGGARPGSRRSRRWWRRSRAPAPPSSSPTCCRCWTSS